MSNGQFTLHDEQGLGQALPSNFLFTQYSLTAFDNCPLKFKKRYIENLKWDSLPDKDARQRLETGKDFHLLANRYFLGIETGMDESTEEFAKLGEWIQNLNNSFPISNDAMYLPEHKLRMSSASLRLEANFDLLIVKGDAIEIWDWKTHGENAQKKKESEYARLKTSLQTMVYLYVLKEQSALVAGKEVDYDKISMKYWQPDPPQTLVEIQYSRNMHEQFRDVLENKISYILEYDYLNFDKIPYSKHCRYCEFNWLCNGQGVDFSAVEE